MQAAVQDDGLIGGGVVAFPVCPLEPEGDVPGHHQPCAETPRPRPVSENETPVYGVSIPWVVLRSLQP